MADGEDQFTAPAVQVARVRRRLMVFLEPAAVMTAPSHVLLPATGRWLRQGRPPTRSDRATTRETWAPGLEP